MVGKVLNTKKNTFFGLPIVRNNMMAVLTSIRQNRLKSVKKTRIKMCIRDRF